MEMDTDSQPQNQPFQANVYNQKGFFPIVIGIVVLLAVVAVGAYYLGTQNNEPTVSPTESSQYPPSTTNPNPTSDTMVNWKSYISTKAKYSFKYPPEWPLVNVPTSPQCTVCVEDIQFNPFVQPTSGDSTIAVILVFKEDNIKSLDDYVNIHVKGDQSKVDLKYTAVGGERAVSYKLSGGIPPLPVIEYAVYKNGFYYIIRIDDSPETNKNKERNVTLFDEMLTTFNFTN